MSVDVHRLVSSGILHRYLYLGAFQLLEVVAILRSSGAGLADRCPAEKGISGRGLHS